MKRILFSLSLGLTAALLAFPAAAAFLDCDELVEKIDKRLESKKVSDYQLKVVPVGEKHPGKEVGRCQGGTQKVMLERGKTVAAAGNE